MGAAYWNKYYGNGELPQFPIRLAHSGGEIAALFLTTTMTSQLVLPVLVIPFLYGTTNGMTTH